MQLISPVRVIAACAGLSGFAVAMLAGLAADNPADVILSRAVAALFVCYVAGGVIGFAMDFAVREGVERYKAERPSPLDSQKGEEQEAPSGTRQAA